MRTFVLLTLPGWLTLLGLAVGADIRVNMTTTLGELSGSVVSERGTPNIHVFYGIPYATPPVGSLRFKPPEEAMPWNGTREATRLPCSCWQALDISHNRVPMVEMWNPNTNMSEDCLYLNVWIPDTATRKAVMVWIYGGGFWAGTSTLDVYNALKLASRNDIIVASFNYRVGPFGFLYGDTSESPGNVGLLDQVEALKWIKNNAALMGGDPKKITIFGESAGAVSVGFHLMSPLSMDLFTYAILMSGSPTAHWGIQTHSLALNRTLTLAYLLECRAGDLKETVKCLKSVNPQALADIQFNLTKYYFEPPFAPIVDQHFLPEHPDELLADGKVKNTSIITGVVKDEGTYWLLYGFPSVFHVSDTDPVSSKDYTAVVSGVLAALGPNFTLDAVRDLAMREYYDTVPPWARSYLDATDDISGDTLFKCPLINFSEYYRSRVKGHVFMYSFEYRVSTNDWPLWLGVAHGYEIEMFLGLPWFQLDYTDKERSFSDDVMTRISNFAKTGNPNYGSKTMAVQWTEYTSRDQHYLVMNADKVHVSQGLRFSQCEFWRTQVPLLQQQAAACSGTHSVDAADRLTSRPPQHTLLALFIVLAFTDFQNLLTISSISGFLLLFGPGMF